MDSPFKWSNSLVRHSEVRVHAAEYTILAAFARQTSSSPGNAYLGVHLSAGQVNEPDLGVAPLILVLLQK